MNLVKTAAYTALDWCTFGRGVQRVICGETVRFPARWSRWYASDYEPNTFTFLRAHCRPGDVVFDIGAHLGLFTVVMAKLVGPKGRVASFEPTPLSREVLTETVQLNGCEDVVDVRPEAVSGAVGNATFFDTGTVASNANSLVQTSRSRSGYTVPIVDLDGFCGARGWRPTCLKIDAEGAELDVLRGAREVFRSCRPSAALSLHPTAFSDAPRTLRKIWDVLHDYGMTVSLLEGYGESLNDKTEVSADWFCSRKQVFDVAVRPGESHS